MHHWNRKWIVPLFALVLASTLVRTLKLGAQHGDDPGLQISSDNWGRVTAPVYDTSEQGIYAGAELFAGPNKFGNYFSGVLPNGRIVTPAGVSVQVGMNPLGIALTPDGKYLITSNDDERDGTLSSVHNSSNQGGYTLSVIDTTTMTVVSQITTAVSYFIGLQVTGSGPYTLWAAGGASHSVKLFAITPAGVITSTGNIPIAPILPQNAGYVSNYIPSQAAFNPVSNKPPVPTNFNRTKGSQLTFPAGLTLSPDQKYLYVACNGDNSVAVIDTATKTVVRRLFVGYFPYAVSVSNDGQRVMVSNWGITEYKFKSPQYDNTGTLIGLPPIANNQPDGSYVPPTSTSGANPKTSSVSLLTAANGNGANLVLDGSIYEGHALDVLNNVGDTHPSATVVVKQGNREVLYVTKSNSDAIGLIRIGQNQAGTVKLPDFNLSLIHIRDSSSDEESSGKEDSGEDGDSTSKVHGAYPNAVAVSPDNARVYVAEAGINSVAVLDTRDPEEPRLLGRIPTGWYPTALTVSPDGHFLYIANAKGIGEDINPATQLPVNAPVPTGLASFPGVDSNYIFGSVQKVDLTTYSFKNSRTVLNNNFSLQPQPKDTSIVPVGGAPSRKIKHVFFILHENKTFDSMLGNLPGEFGPFASMTFNKLDGTPYTNGQYTGVSLNTQLLASKFAAAVNYYSDSEESDAGHQFAASGTASDYTEKTLLVKAGRDLLVNKNFEPEDYPESGYIFNNAARHGVSFKDYGALIRIEGTDTGTSSPTTLTDPLSGQAGFPKLNADNFSVTNPLQNVGNTTSLTQGLGQLYFLAMPVVAILGGNNANGEARIDRNYPGYNFNISDQRRAIEFNNDFDRMVKQGTLPKFVYIYQPNDHTGSVQAPNGGIFTNTGLQEIADGDVALGMVVKHIMESPVYYDAASGEGSAIFVTWDDAQSSLDHIHPHRTPLLVISPFAKPAYVAKRHYNTASVVKTEELLLGLPPNNLGDLFATDLRDMFQPVYNGIRAQDLSFAVQVTYQPSPEGRRIWALASKLDTSAPDRDSHRLGALTRLSLAADNNYNEAKNKGALHSKPYRSTQQRLYRTALDLVRGPKPRDLDD